MFIAIYFGDNILCFLKNTWFRSLLLIFHYWEVLLWFLFLRRSGILLIGIWIGLIWWAYWRCLPLRVWGIHLFLLFWFLIKGTTAVLLLTAINRDYLCFLLLWLFMVRWLLLRSKDHFIIEMFFPFCFRWSCAKR